MSRVLDKAVKLWALLGLMLSLLAEWHMYKVSRAKPVRSGLMWFTFGQDFKDVCLCAQVLNHFDHNLVTFVCGLSQVVGIMATRLCYIKNS